MSRPLPELAPGQCAAVVQTADSNHGAKHYSMQRIVLYASKRCSRKAKERVGPLHLCQVHARLAREGFVAKDGTVCDRSTIRDARNNPRVFPNGFYDWAKDER